MPTVTDELKPCPFCGGQAEVTQVSNDTNWFGVYCHSCENSEVVACGASSPERAIELWNTRPLEDALRARLFSMTCRECGDRLRSHYCPTCGKSMGGNGGTYAELQSEISGLENACAVMATESKRVRAENERLLNECQRIRETYAINITVEQLAARIRELADMLDYGPKGLQ